MSKPRSAPIPLRNLAFYALGVGFALAAVLAIESARGPHPADEQWAHVGGSFVIALAGISVLETRRRRQELEPKQARNLMVRNGLVAVFGLAALLNPLHQGLTTLLSAAMVLLSADAIMLIHRSIGAAIPRRGARIGVGVLTVLMGLTAWLSLTMVVLQLQVTPALVGTLHAGKKERLTAHEVDVEFVTSDGLVLHGVFQPGDPGFPAVIVCHGLGDDSRAYGEFATTFRALGCTTLRFDFRAHGRSEGAVSTVTGNEVRDVLAAVSFVEQQDGVTQGDVFLFGHSMGGGATLTAAAELDGRVRGVIAIAPAVDLEAMATEILSVFGPLKTPMAALARLWTLGLTGFDLGRGAALERFEAAGELPVLIFHSEGDVVVPPAQSRSFHHRYPHTEMVWLDGNHNELKISDYLDPIDAFLSRHRMAAAGREIGTPDGK